jgi:hypothetical protein
MVSSDTTMHIPPVIRNPRFSAHSCPSYYHEPFTKREKAMKFISLQLQLRKNDNFVQIWRVSPLINKLIQ